MNIFGNRSIAKMKTTSATVWIDRTTNVAWLSEVEWQSAPELHFHYIKGLGFGTVVWKFVTGPIKASTHGGWGHQPFPVATTCNNQQVWGLNRPSANFTVPMSCENQGALAAGSLWGGKSRLNVVMTSKNSELLAVTNWGVVNCSKFWEIQTWLGNGCRGSWGDGGHGQ